LNCQAQPSGYLGSSEWVLGAAEKKRDEPGNLDGGRDLFTFERDIAEGGYVHVFNGLVE